jgi:subfamily B ATP-binding cassette protein MsbA
MKVYLRLLSFAKPYVFYIIASFICMLILSGTTSAIAYLVKPAIDDVFLKQDFRMLVVIPILLIIVFFVKGLTDFGQSYLMGYAGNSTVTDIREAVYRHIQSLSLSFFTKTSTGTLMSRIANDVDILRRAVSDSIKKVLRNFFLVIGLTGVAFYQNWKMSLFCFLLLPWVLIPIVRLGRKSKRYSRRSQERMGRISTFLDETISGNQTVKAFCMENYANERFIKEIDRLFRINIRNLKVSALSSPIMEIFGGLLGAAIIYYGGYSVIQGSMTTGEFTSFIAAVGLLYRPIKTLGRENLKVQSGLAAAVRVFEVLDLIPEIKDKPNAVQLPAFREFIEFRNVSFRYEDQWVLKNLNLKAEAGKIVAIVGHSGAGKTTIVNLLLRFYDVTSGGIFIDGIDIKDVTIKSLRQQIAVVTQQTILFNDTVRNNICYGSYAITDEKIIQAAKAAYAHEFIKAMPEGYETFIGEKGVKLSGGQCQRISIARALVKDVPILILDEATSSLDTHSEREVQQALENLMQGRTTFLIAHRLSTVRNAHQIIVLSDGEIVERGTHDDLLQQKGVYNKLIDIQSGYHKKISNYDHIY